MSEETGPYLIAKAGEIVTCESGHEICDVAEDIYGHGRIASKQFANFRWDYAPKSGETVPNCPQCGARFILARAPHLGGGVVHIDDEWRGVPRMVERFLAERTN